jgi:hypothetical protein
LRSVSLVTLPLLGALLSLPTRSPAQVAVSVAFGTNLGPEIGVSSYSPDRVGVWKSTYRHWKPVTLYDVNGRYYRGQVHGARALLVYTYQNEYFLPPQDKEWTDADARYDYSRQPSPADYARVRPMAPTLAAVDPQFGEEVGVFGYSRDRAGDWRTHYLNWTPVTVYEVQGRYFHKKGPHARQVTMYRYHQEYFLPPDDPAWINVDKRFDYAHRPNKDDHGRLRNGP